MAKKRERGQRMGVGYPQITDPETIGSGTPFLVESYLPGKEGRTTVMTGIFLGRPFSDDKGRAVRARVRQGDTRKGKIQLKVLYLGLDLGFYDKAFRNVYRLPKAPF